jgi:hypothetical protein
VSIRAYWIFEVRFPAGEGDFSLLHSFQTVCGAPLTSSSVDTGSYFPGAKVAVELKTHLHLVPRSTIMEL